MPSTLPYDPTLILGNIVPQKKLDILLKISALQAPADAAEDNLNSKIALKRSFDMTIQEIANMGIDDAKLADLTKKSASLSDVIATAAMDYANAKLKAEEAIIPLKSQIQSISEQIESPIDFTKSQIKPIPLSFDSLKLNCQYFSNEDNEQTAGTHAATISAFVSGSLSELGNQFSAQAKFATQQQVNSQTQNHDISGTLVVSVNCTHKVASVFAPFVLDVDKGIRAWNKMYPDDMIKTDDPKNLADIEKNSETKDEKSYCLLSGATYGSCFIGMVHILNTTNTTSSETLISTAESLQTQFTVGSWVAQASGGFGVDSSFANDAKNLLSAQNISSHCTIISLGSIPSIKSNQVQHTVKQFTQFDGKSAMDSVAQVQNATASDMDTIDSAAQSARTGQQMIAMKSATVKSALAAMADIDTASNKVLDTNSMMNALEDYVNKCLDGNLGIPINFYLKPITKSQLAQMWLAKYYPNKFNNPQPDPAPAQDPAPSPAPSPAPKA